MKSGLVLTALILLVFTPLWVPYGAFVVKSSGNPNWDSYAGEPGSTYDAGANPPQTIGTVAYDPYAPLAQPAPRPPGAR